MYIAMNRFSIVPGRETEFETLWQDRETHLEQVPGFLDFHLVRGEKQDTSTLYASHSTCLLYTSDAADE